MEVSVFFFFFEDIGDIDRHIAIGSHFRILLEISGRKKKKKKLVLCGIYYIEQTSLMCFQLIG